MTDFRMPSLGADMEFGTLVEWRVKPGDRVHRGDVVAQVETQKGVIEVEIFDDGVVSEICVAPGTKVPVGGVLARLGNGAAPPAVAAAPSPLPPTPVAPPIVAPPIVAPPIVAPPIVAPPIVAPPIVAPATRAVEALRLRVSPLARRMAADLGVDLGGVTGTGEEGAITRADVERAAVARVAAPPVAAAVAPAPELPSAAPRPAAPAMRAAIATAMERSNREIPHYYLSTEADMTRALAWLRDRNATRSVTERLLPAALLLRAAARALRAVPGFNGYWTEGAFHPSERIHLGVAISLREGGLVLPAIHDADTLDADALNARLLDLVQRARTGGLRSSELTDPTVTVTNLGDQGVQSVFGVIYPPQVALIGFGRVAERPWAEGGMIGSRPTVTITLAADHRASDGHRGAQLLAALCRQLEEDA